MMEKKEKVAFNTFEEASVELNRIIDTNYSSWKTIKPSRIYLENGKYYLTSKPSIYIY